MDFIRFEDLARILARAPSRRHVLRGLAGAGLGLATLRPSLLVEAKKKKHKRKKRTKHKKHKTKQPPMPNKFGCFEVGDPCTSEADCCSSICDGGTCRAHDTGICQQGVAGACSATSAEDLLAVACHGTYCFCFRTTAGSNICSAGPFTNGDSCADCKTDADCEALGFPAGSACAPVSAGICGVCPSGTACLAPCTYE